MDTIDEMNSAISAIVPLLIAKGVINAAAELHIRANETPQIWLRGSDSQGVQFGSYGAHIVNGDTVSICFQQAMDFISEMQDPETAALHRYMQKLGDVVDQGRKYGIPDEYVDPVSLTVKAMSDNLLTHEVTS